MKIAIIGQKGIPAVSGGVEKHVEELSVRLARAGHEVLVYARRNYSPSYLREYRGVKLVSLPTVATKHLDAISHTFLAILDARKRDLDVIHFHSIGPSSLIWLVKLLKPGVPIVATFHTQCYYHKKWSMLARVYLRFGEAVACYLADKTIVISKVLKKYAQEKYGVDLEYIPNGVSTIPVGRPQAIKQWGLRKNGYIVAISRLVRHKGIHHLIKAYTDLNTDLKLVIVGDGSFTPDYVEELHKLAGKNDNIIFTGAQTGQALAELYAHARIFVQPSESEGLSIALLEAMSYGVPVLVSDIPENIEAIGEYGHTFENKSVKDLGTKLDELLASPVKLKRKALLNKTRVDREYDWGVIAEQTANLYLAAIVERKMSTKRFLRLDLAKKFLGLF